MPTLSITADRPLRFGTMVVVNATSRRVSAAGEVSDTGASLGRPGDAGPASFTIAYDRGEESSRPITITLEIVFSPVAGQNSVGSVTAFDTDLAGVGEVVPGHPVTATIRGCTTRVCTLSFSLGARLDVARAGAGGAATMLAPVSATVVDVAG